MLIDKYPEYFLTVVKEGSVSKAAQKLHVSQPYLSRYILRLEEAFQVQLLDRGKSPLQATDAGRIYANYLESSKQMYQKLTRDFDAIRTRHEQTLRLGFSNWRAGALLPDILPFFTQRYPDVRLEFSEVPNHLLYQLIADETTDFAIMNTTQDTPDYVATETLMYEKILLVGNRSHPVTAAFLDMQGAGHPLDLHLLEDERVILLPAGAAIAERVNNYLDNHRIVLRNTVLSANATTAINLTAQNYGFCFLNETGMHSAPNAQELVFFDLQSDDLIHPLCAVYKKRSYLSPIARAFIDMMIVFYKDRYGHI